MFQTNSPLQVPLFNIILIVVKQTRGMAVSFIIFAMNVDLGNDVDLGIRSEPRPGPRDPT